MEINELLKIEKDFQEANRNNPLIINQYGEMEYIYTNEDLSFLMKGYLRKHYEATTDDTWQDLKAKGLNEFEALMLVCFEGFLSYAFKWPSYNDKPSPIPEMCDALESVLDKAPQYSENKVLYRFCTLDDKVDFAVGDTYKCPHFLTTTKDNWNKRGNTFIVSTKENGSNARMIYKLYKHGEEKQVSFKRGTCFLITQIQEDELDKIIYLKEI